VSDLTQEEREMVAAMTRFTMLHENHVPWERLVAETRKEMKEADERTDRLMKLRTSRKESPDE
jgi:hypothetical protein